MTEDQIKEIGFKFVKEYPHDYWVTRRYSLGPMHVEFTYRDNKIESIEMTIEEINCINVTIDSAQQLASILAPSKQV